MSCVWINPKYLAYGRDSNISGIRGSVVSDPCDPRVAHQAPWNSAGKNTGVGSLSLLQGIFPTQGSNPGVLHCRQILYH